MHITCLARTAFLFVLASTAVSAQTTQQDVSRAEATSPERHQSAEAELTTCVIEGLVVRSDTSEPIRKARVVIYRLKQAANRYGGVTDSSGRFSVDGIAPGRYKIRIEKVGYLSQFYGEDPSGGPTAILTLSSGQRITDLLFRMVAEGVISGRILDEDGASVQDAVITALRSHVYHGQHRLSAVATVESNDLGEYRVYDLPPGRYYVRVEARLRYPKEKNPQTGNAAAPTETGYAAVFYPGTSDAKKAIPVTVLSGQETPISDVTLVPTPAVRLRGHVFNAITGKPLTGCCVFLEPGGGVFLDDNGPGHLTGPNGAFEIDHVATGSFILVASAFTDGRFHDARLPIEVQSVSLDGLNLTIFPEVKIAGRVAVEGSNPVQLSTLQVRLEDLERGYSSVLSAAVSRDGTFQLTNVAAGRYAVGFQGGPDGTYLKSVRFHGESSSDAVVDVNPGGAQGLLEIALDSDGCQVEGSVTDRDRLPVPSATVVLVPGGQRRDFYHLYKDVKTDQNGNFVLNGIAPGDYEVFAWKDIEHAQWEDPDFLEQFERDAVKISAEDHGHKSIELKVTQASMH